MRPRHLLGAALAALVLTACQSSASPAPSASEPDRSLDPSQSFVGDPDLEATLPEEAAGIIFFQSISMSGPDFVDAEINDQFLDFVDELGADLDDVSVAFAIGANADGTNTASVFAFQVDGAESDELIAAFQAGAPDDGALEWHEQTVGGKPAQVAEPTDEFPTPAALYATGDTLYVVTSTSAQAFEEILTQLP